MADKKKEEGGDSIFKKDLYKEVLYVLLPLLLVVAYLLNRLVIWLKSLQYSALSIFWAKFLGWLHVFWNVWHVIAALIAIGCTVWAWHSYRGMKKIEEEEGKIYGSGSVEKTSNEGVVEMKQENEKWIRIMDLTNSPNASDWRLAIIEADIMLEELLRVNNYHGNTIGDMLKAVEPSDMLTLDNAWEAHKVRNRIAHSGSDFQLNDRDAKRIISLYESVFREFQII